MMNFVILVISLIIFMCICVRGSTIPINQTSLNMTDKNAQVDRVTVIGRSISEVENRKKKDNNDIMSRIIPMLVMPFMMSMTMLPMTLTSMKFMLLKGMIMGKLAIIIAVINLIRNMNDRSGGLYSHNVNVKQPSNDISMAHYGYTGGEEYGAYVNRRKRKVGAR